MALSLRLDELEHLAQRFGYEDYRSFLHDQYTIKKMSIGDIAKSLHITHPHLVRNLKRFKIPIRPSKSGPIKIFVTRQLVEAVMREGLRPIAAQLGVTTDQLAKSIKKAVKVKRP